MKEIVLIIDRLCGGLLNTVCVCVCACARVHACVCNPLAWGPVKVIFIALL